MPLDPNIAVLLTFIENAGYPPMSEGTVAQARQGLRTLMVDMRDPATLVPVASVAPGLAGDVPVRVYRPEAEGPVPTIVFFHGGGFVIGDLDTHENVCRQLCRDVGAVVVSVDYPLAPEHPFPAGPDAGWNALTWAVLHVDEYGGDATRIAVGGDSAGGNIAAVCAQRARREGIALAAQLLVYPAVDMLGEYASRVDNAEGYFLTLADMEWFATKYLGVTDPGTTEAEKLARDPRVSPLLSDDLGGLPPAVVATAEFDPLRDEGNAYADALAAAAGDVRHRQFPGLIHGFYGMESISPAVADATAWINAELRGLLAPQE